ALVGPHELAPLAVLQAEQEAARAPAAPQLGQQAVAPRLKERTHFIDVERRAALPGTRPDPPSIQRKDVLLVSRHQDARALRNRRQLEVADRIEGRRRDVAPVARLPDPLRP